jgi:heme exporter protein CcmD
MIWTADHAGFVVAAYALSFSVLVGLIALIIHNDRKNQQAVAKLANQPDQIESTP